MSKLTIWRMLCQVAAEERVAIRVHVLVGHLPRFFAYRFYRIHLSYVEILLVLMDLSRRAALLFQMYSLSKDIYDKWVLFCVRFLPISNNPSVTFFKIIIRITCRILIFYHTNYVSCVYDATHTISINFIYIYRVSSQNYWKIFYNV